jgi:hypothetical protein
MRLDNDMSLTFISIHRCHWQLGLCAVHLAAGHAVSCRAVKAATMEKCLRNVAKFCARSNSCDPRKIDQSQKALALPIQKVLDEVKRWENIPSRREPFTIEMSRCPVELAASKPHIYGPDSHLNVMIDFASCGLHDGFRLSEWAQPNEHSALQNPQQNSRDEPVAFCLNDFRFCSDDKVHIPPEQVLALDPKSRLVGRDFALHRTQKNGQNGEERQHARNDTAGAPCHITSAMRIVQRFVRLVGKKFQTPLGIHRRTDGAVRFITASIVETTFRMAASLSAS